MTDRPTLTFTGVVPARVRDLIKLAELAHEVQRVVGTMFRRPLEPKWSEAPLWKRANTINSVARILAHPEATPADDHNLWLAYRLVEGWRHGSEENHEMREHPDMVPWDQLGPEQKLRDTLFLEAVRTTARVFGISSRQK